jgi:hypothetical protein
MQSWKPVEVAARKLDIVWRYSQDFAIN